MRTQGGLRCVGIVWRKVGVGGGDWVTEAGRAGDQNFSGLWRGNENGFYFLQPLQRGNVNNFCSPWPLGRLGGGEWEVGAEDAGWVVEGGTWMVKGARCEVGFGGWEMHDRRVDVRMDGRADGRRAGGHSKIKKLPWYPNMKISLLQPQYRHRHIQNCKSFFLEAGCATGKRGNAEFG